LNNPNNPSKNPKNPNSDPNQKKRAHMRLELKLKEIHLQNFRLFDDLKVSFDEQLTVFISENGAGKTSLLEGIAKTLFIFTEVIMTDGLTVSINDFVTQRNIQTVLSKSAYHSVPAEFTDNDIQYGKKSSTISNSIDYIMNNIVSNQEISLTKQRLKQEQLLKGRELSTVGRNTNEAIKQDQLKCLPVVIYYPSERAHFASDNLESDNNILSIYKNALIGKPMIYKHFLEWYVWQSQMAVFSKTPNHVLQQVHTAILSMLNDNGEKTYNDLFIDPSQFRNPRLMVSKNDKIVEINQLSSGEKNLFVLVSDLARRLCLANPLSANPLKEGQGVVLIDEIDLHLHPQWQRKILTKLKSIFPKIQWVVTTHSPFVLAAEEVHPQNAYLLTDEIKSDGTTQKIAVSIDDLGKFNQGLEPNRIFSEIMRVPLRNQATEIEIQQLHQLLNPKDFEKPVFEQLFQQLSHKLGIHDPVMVRANHRISVLKRQKQNEIH
jgi:predicted ATP-binding protein involved in virulence